MKGQIKVPKDFDRLFVAQSIVEGIVLLTVNSVVAKYGSPTQKI